MTIEEDKKRDAERCLQLAESALSSGNLEKAERLLKKAERLYPTTLAKQMLKDVQVAKGEDASGESVGSDDTDRTGYNSETSNTTFSGEHKRTEEDKTASESCIEIAKSAISTGKFDKAKNFLLKSVRLYPNDTAKELLDKLDELEKNYSSTSYNGAGPSTLGNMDEAEKSIQIAEREFAASRFARAERLLHKAERLYATARAKDLLRQIEDAKASGLKDTEAERPNGHTPHSNRQANGRQSQNQENERPRRQEPTAEQIEAIKRVKEGKNDFEILGVEEGCSAGDVRKAFRRHTLLLHPDKNKAPGAKEAFMIVTEASERLLKKRKTDGRRTM